MGSIVNSTFVSLDGVVNHMETWHFAYVDAEASALAMDQLAASDAMLMGRATYDVYASSWPERDGEYADRINALPKYVVSSTLTDPQWNSSVISGDVVEQVRALKQEGGGSILMHGYGPVAKTLLGAGLLDELHLWFHPVLAGVGGKDELLHTDGLTVAFDHADTRALKSGVVVLSYRAKAT